MAKKANTTPPQEDNFDYGSIENHMYLPDTELTIYGAEMMQLKGRLEKFLHDNTQAVFGPDNQPSGHFLQPYLGLHPRLPCGCATRPHLRSASIHCPMAESPL